MNLTLQLICICTIYFILFNTLIESPISRMWHRWHTITIEQLTYNNKKSIKQFQHRYIPNHRTVPSRSYMQYSQASYFHGISKVAYKIKFKGISGKSVGSDPVSSQGRWCSTEWLPWQRWKSLADGPIRCSLYRNYRPVLEDIDLQILRIQFCLVFCINVE